MANESALKAHIGNMIDTCEELNATVNSEAENAPEWNVEQTNVKMRTRPKDRKQNDSIPK